MSTTANNRRQLCSTAVCALALSLGLGLGLTGCALEPDASDRRDDDLVVEGEVCLHAEAFWRTHPELWPVGELTLGANVYVKAELLLILDTPVDHDPLVALAHDLIVAKLNLAVGAAGEVIAHAVATADLLIGPLEVPPIGEGHVAVSLIVNLLAALGDFNGGLLGSSLCADDSAPPPAPSCGNHVVEAGETCDDGNTLDNDGCDSACQTEHQCGCGHPDGGPTEGPGPGPSPGAPSHLLPTDLDDLLEDVLDGVDSGVGGLAHGLDATLHGAGLEPTLDGAIDAVDDIVEGAEAGLEGTALGDVVSEVDDLLHPESDCGNGIVEPGELCDAGDDNGLLGSLCSLTCELLDDLLP